MFHHPVKRVVSSLRAQPQLFHLCCLSHLFICVCVCARGSVFICMCMCMCGLVFIKCRVAGSVKTPGGMLVSLTHTPEPLRAAEVSTQIQHTHTLNKNMLFYYLDEG